MVSSKKVHCAYCQKKCSGNVLRYQDQYYHKQCFELEQSDSLAAAAASQQPDRGAHVAPGETGVSGSSARPELQSESADESTTNSATKSTLRQKLLHSSSSSSKTTRTFTTHSQANLNSPQANSNNNQNGQQRIETGSLGQRSSSSSRQNLPAVSSSSSAYHLMSQSSEQSSRMSPSNPDATAASSSRIKSQTIDSRAQTPARQNGAGGTSSARAATLPHSVSSPSNGFRLESESSSRQQRPTICAGCRERINDGQALIALDLHWHVWCFKCAQCKTPLHGEYVAKDNKAYCERDYQKLFGITCVYCKRYITGKVLQAGEAHHFHPSCARCSKCGDPFVPGEEMYLQGEVTWHPRCGPGPNGAESTLGLEPAVGVDPRAQVSFMVW